MHIIWVAKYGCPVLTGDIRKRCRELLIQIRDAEDIRKLKRDVSKDHMHMEYSARLSVSDIVKRLKDRASRRLQGGFSELKKRYWGRRYLGNRVLCLVDEKYN